MKRLLIAAVLLCAPQAAIAEHRVADEEPPSFPEFIMEPLPVTWEETRLSPAAPQLVTPAGTPHRFPYGQCTWFVGTQRTITFRGHARDWPVNAVRAGHVLSDTPVVGSIIVTRESRYGHVAVVTSFTETVVTIQESNVRGLGVISTRTLSRSDPRIRTYIL